MKTITPTTPTNRIEAFSDGVLAIVITLMVLEIKLPDLKEPLTTQEALDQLSPLLPKILAYALSFLMITIFWVNHHQLFHSIGRSTRTLLWLNALWLFWVCLLPFPTAFLGQHPYLWIAILLFGSEMFVCAWSFYLMRKHCYLHQLITDDPENARLLVRKSKWAPLLYLGAILGSFLSIYISYAIFIAVPIIFIMSSFKSLKK